MFLALIDIFSAIKKQAEKHKNNKLKATKKN